VKLVIDPGSLRIPKHAERVRTHLSVSPKNEVIFTDFALQEAFNGANIRRLRRTFAPVKEFGAQIIALKITPQICRREPNANASSEQFVDELQSNRLRAYLHDVFTETEGVHERITLDPPKPADDSMNFSRQSHLFRKTCAARSNRFPRRTWHC